MCSLQMNYHDLDALTYLLSSSSFLLYMLTKSTKGNLDEIIQVNLVKQDPSSPPSDNTSLYLQPLQSGKDFVVQLREIVGKCYSLILSSVCTKMDSLLESSVLIEKMGKFKSDNNPNLEFITSLLTKVLCVFQTNFVYISFSQQFFSEVFARINGMLFNAVLLRYFLLSSVHWLTSFFLDNNFVLIPLAIS
jgi:hypothetical protein